MGKYTIMFGLCYIDSIKFQFQYNQEWSDALLATYCWPDPNLHWDPQQGIFVRCVMWLHIYGVIHHRLHGNMQSLTELNKIFALDNLEEKRGHLCHTDLLNWKTDSENDLAKIPLFSSLL